MPRTTTHAAEVEAAKNADPTVALRTAVELYHEAHRKPSISEAVSFLTPDAIARRKTEHDDRDGAFGSAQPARWSSVKSAELALQDAQRAFNAANPDLAVQCGLAMLESCLNIPDLGDDIQTLYQALQDALAQKSGSVSAQSQVLDTVQRAFAMAQSAFQTKEFSAEEFIQAHEKMILNLVSLLGGEDVESAIAYWNGLFLKARQSHDRSQIHQQSALLIEEINRQIQQVNQLGQKVIDAAMLLQNNASQNSTNEISWYYAEAYRNACEVLLNAEMILVVAEGAVRAAERKSREHLPVLKEHVIAAENDVKKAEQDAQSARASAAQFIEDYPELIKQISSLGLSQQARSASPTFFSGAQIPKAKDADLNTSSAATPGLGQSDSSQ